MSRTWRPLAEAGQGDGHAWAVRLLPDHHRDPFDRLLVAQADVERATLVTSDAILSRYDVPVLWS
ncbi:MAG: hypothetical protein H0V81_14145 [Solirubrobacterales bacterium]|nr:hypothetical protein [Solirubrobacterales bacterium]